jgi:hypothetical protein
VLDLGASRVAMVGLSIVVVIVIVIVDAVSLYIAPSIAHLEEQYRVERTRAGCEQTCQLALRRIAEGHREPPWRGVKCEFRIVAVTLRGTARANAEDGAS